MMTREVESVLVRSADSAAERKHWQTTPLHVAATLFAAPSGLLRRSCLSSLPDSSGPDCCRALEHCFSIALNNLPSGGGQASAPRMSNALMAAIEHAQASQLRKCGCPEHQLQLAAPFVAVRVEIEQLVVSILDDPQVSYVMWEAGFSSDAVKAVVEQSLSSSSSNSSTALVPITTVPVLTMNPSPVSPVPTFPAHLSVNPRLLNVSGAAGAGGGEKHRTEEVKRIMSTLSRLKKRNPIVVGDFDTQAVTKAVFQTIKSGLAPPPLRTARVISFAKELATAATTGDKSWIAAKTREVGSTMLCDDMITIVGVVVDIGDIKYLVESPVQPPTTTSTRINSQQPVSETACAAAVAEMARLLKMFRDADLDVWLLGTATYSTYLRCQIYHPTMDDDWDLQPLQIAQSCQILPRIDLIKKLYQGLLDKVSWQPEAASATATTLLRPKTGNRRGHTWILYLGPDKIGKWKMATALSELVFRAPPVVVKLSDTDCEEEGECTGRFHGWASMDHLVEAIRRNPFAVVLIEEFDRTDDVSVTRNIKMAMEQGRMVDSFGREVGLGSVVFVLTSSNWFPEEFKRSHESLIQCEEKVLRAADRRRRFRLELSTEKTRSKRCVDWQEDGNPPAKLRRPPLSLDLRLALGTAAGKTPDEESSDAKVERNVSKGRLAVGADEHSTLSVASEMVQLVDGVVMFKPVNFALKRQRATETISKSFEATVGEKWSIRIDEEVIDLVVGAQLIAGYGLEEWCEAMLTPLCKELKGTLIAADSAAIVRLSVVEVSGTKAVGGDRA